MRNRNQLDLSLMPAMPASSKDLIAQRTVKARKLHDILEQVHFNEYDNSERYVALLTALTPDQSVEGSITADDYSAAMHLREAAVTAGAIKQDEHGLQSVVHALRVLMNRDKTGRRLRIKQIKLLMARAPEDNGA